jgi:hypothetical protein
MQVQGLWYLYFNNKTDFCYSSGPNQCLKALLSFSRPMITIESQKKPLKTQKC